MKVKLDMQLVDIGNPKNAVYSAIKCKPLRFGSGGPYRDVGNGGRSWEQSLFILDLEENKIATAWIDTTWGHWGYFKLNGQWYKVNTHKYKSL